MPTKKKIFIFENPFTLANSLVKKFVQIAEISIEKNGCFNVALTGGKSIVEFYSKLAGFRGFFSWQNTHIFLTDERFVPWEHPESNFRMIKEMLLNDIMIPRQNIHPVDTRKDNVFLAVKSYEKVLREKLLIRNEYPQFDLILLSLGEDGHVASLFPGEKDLEEGKAAVIAAYPSHLKTDRISLSMPVLNNARNLNCIVIGKKKAKALQYVIDQKQDIPAARLNCYDGEVCFFVDKEAADCLRGKDWEIVDENSFLINL